MATAASSFVRTYMQLLETNPIVTKSVTSAIIGAAGDIIQQSFERWDLIKSRLHNHISRFHTSTSTDPTHSKDISSSSLLSLSNDGNTHEKDEIRSSGPEYIDNDIPSSTYTSTTASTLKSRDLLSSSSVIQNYPKKSSDLTTPTPLNSLNYDWLRTLRMSAYGLFIVGPMCHGWMKCLEHIVPRSDAIGAIAKMSIDQATMAPFGTALFFGCVGMMEMKPWNDVKHSIYEKTWPTLILNWKIWPAAQFVNMYFVPLQLRVLFLNTVGLGYSTVLSKIANTSTIDAKHHVQHHVSVLEKEIPPEVLASPNQVASTQYHTHPVAADTHTHTHTQTHGKQHAYAQ